MLTQVKGRPNRDQLRVSTFRGWSKKFEKVSELTFSDFSAKLSYGIKTLALAVNG